VTSIFAFVADCLPILPKIEDNGDEKKGDKSKKAVGPVKSELLEHGMCEDRKASSECRPEKIISSIH
jgi:hypothetical protein